jgi:flavin reductase (DIM6/NTAB) family NADH-FMN oxidoreductase RutF
MPVTPFDFRATMARFASGVTVVTTTLDQTYYGLTVSAFCSVSLTPPLVLVSLDLTSQTFPIIRQSGVFAVNVLTQDQEALALRFASKDLQRKTFEDIPLRIGEAGAPLFSESLARIECRLAGVYPAGDHALMLGEVVHVDVGMDNQAKAPLLYYRSSFLMFHQEISLTELLAVEALTW